MQYEKIVAMKNREESRETFDLFALLSTLRDEYIPILARNSQMVSFEDGILDVFLERDITIQLLHNVFSNFSKYAGNGTTLVIRAQKKGRKITVWFDDDGRGVQKANVRYLTEKFYQEDEGRSHERGRGIGIGLSLVEKIAKRHG